MARCNACSIPKPSWYTPQGGNGQVTGAISRAALEQCNGIFTSSSADLDSATTTGTLTFDVSASNFTKFVPRGIIFHVANPAGTQLDDLERMVAYTALNYQGVNYKLDANPTPLALFSVWAFHALSAVEIGELTPGGQDVTIDVSLVQAPSAGTLRVTAEMYGFSLRGGNSGQAN